jgi:hypothetical protein
MDYKSMAKMALKKNLTEGYKYPDNMRERMHPEIQKQLRERKHSLGNHPAFPESNEINFDEKIVNERFIDVVKRYKRAFDIENVDATNVVKMVIPLLIETIELEKPHHKELVKLAIDMINEEFDIDKSIIKFDVKLIDKISLSGMDMNMEPTEVEGMKFKNHDEMVVANKEVYKRRFVNALIQGSAKKCNHMFHMVDDELTSLNPRLPGLYAKLMSTADYVYFIMNNLDEAMTGGVVEVEFTEEETAPNVVRVEATSFPVLIHEMVKGVMEIIGANGLPKKKSIANYVINKADFVKAEIWDMRLGPALWGCITEMIPADDFHLKHHIFSDLVSLPVDDFNYKMKEILANTKAGEKIINQIIEEIKKDMSEGDDLSEDLGFDSNKSDDEGYDWDDLMNSL